MRKQQTINTDTLKDMDELLKEKIVELWADAQDYQINSEYIKCYRSYRSMFLSVIGYNFTNKTKIQDMTNVLEEYSNITENSNKMSTLKDIIIFNDTKIELKDILYQYMELIQTSLTELNLWFRMYKSYIDFDEKLSMEIFNSKKRTINQKRKELMELEPIDILNFMTNNQIHNIYAEFLYARGKKLERKP